MRKSHLYSIAFGFSLLVLLFFSLMLYNSINSLNEYSNEVEKSTTIMLNLERLQSLMKDVETSQRGFLLTKDSSFLLPLFESRLEIPHVLDTLQQLSRDNAAHLRPIVELRSMTAMTLGQIEETLPRRRYFGSVAMDERLKACKASMDLFRVKVKEIEANEHALLAGRAESKKNYERITPNYFNVILSITTVIAVISFFMLLKELRQRLSYQHMLEMKFHALNQSNAELQQIAHVTSHDLQEPLRKIRTFCDVLVNRSKAGLDEEVKLIVQRIDQNTLQMKDLVSDLSAFTSLAVTGDALSPVDLNKVLLDVQHELAAQIRLRNARVSISRLPVLRGYAEQLHILFKELIDNAVKFSREEVESVIIITASQIKGAQLDKRDQKYEKRDFTVISIYDNGIGFDKEYAEKIFILFQRLYGHNSPYAGKGIGLAICQRIMSNHDGFISAEGEAEMGATFKLYFPN